MPSESEWAQASRQLRHDGYCIVPDAVDASLLNRLRAAADASGERWSAKVGDDVLASQGSMVGIPNLRDPAFAELIVNPATREALDRLDLPEATFTDGYVISKPPGSPRLFWHFDWYGWTDDSAYETEPVQVFVMCYLTDTTPANGCLRVIPGSHRRRHPLHDLMADGHSELSTAGDLDRPEFADWPDEVDVEVRAGDAVVGDARLLHAAHGNDSGERRSLVTLWYQPRYPSLPPSVQATLAAKCHTLPEAWPEDLRAAVGRLQPPAAPDAEPLPRSIDGPRPEHATTKPETTEPDAVTTRPDSTSPPATSPEITSPTP